MKLNVEEVGILTQITKMVRGIVISVAALVKPASDVVWVNVA